MKILLVIPSLGSGGAERQLVTLGTLFKDEGFDVEFLIYREDYFYLDLLNKKSIKVNVIEDKNYLYRIFAVRNFIRSRKFDAVISFLEITCFLSCFAAIGGKKWKLITTERSSKTSTFLSMRGKIFGWFRKYSDHIVCNSHNAKTLWETFHPSYVNKLSVIYNPVILKEINTEYIYRKNGRLNLVIAASYQYLKNPIGLINAIALMSDESRNKIEVNWYGRIEVRSGDTRAYDEAIELIKTHQLEKNVYLHEATKDIANIMNQADAVGLFSQVEGLPNSICEAMLIGKPIVMSRVSDYSNLVENNGFLCDWDDINSIKDALENLVSLNEAEINQLGLQSQNKARELFSKEYILENWLKVLK